MDLVQVEESTLSEILKSLPPLQKFLVVNDKRHCEEMLKLVLGLAGFLSIYILLHAFQSRIPPSPYWSPNPAMFA